MARNQVLRRGLLRGAVAGVFAATLIAASTTVPASAEVTAVDGGAFGVQVGVTLVGLDTTLVATPSVTLPSVGGGPLTSSLVSVSLPGVLSTGVLDTSTQGGNLNSHAGFATSTASVVDLDVLASLVSADTVSSTCTSNGDGSTGSTTLAGAHVSGFGDLVASPTPNTKITLAGVAEITLNEQTRTDTVGSISTITVTAIHVHLDGLLAGGDVYVARSQCEVTGPDVLTEEPASPGDPGTPTSPSDPGSPTQTPAATPSATPVTPPATPTSATPRFTG